MQAELSFRTIKMMMTGMSEAFLVPAKQIPRVLFHGLILAFIISGFWLLDSLKDPVLANIVGIEYQPTAKLLSVVSTLIVVCLYDLATSLVSKPALFHIVSWSYGIIMMVISARLSDPVKGFANHDKGPHRLLGWFTYFMVESYGSLMVTLFWSYTNSIMNLEEAKGAYGLIISIAQIGAITGSTLATRASTIGISMLFLTGSILIFCVSILIKIYHIVFQDMTTVTFARSRTPSLTDGIHTSSSQARSRANADVIAALSMSGSSSRSRSAATDAETEVWDSWVGVDGGHNNSNNSNNNSNTSEGSTRNITSTRLPALPPVSSIAPHVQSVFWRFLMAIYHSTSGFYEGLVLIMQHSYTMKLLGVSTLFEIILTILDYEFKVMGLNSVNAVTSVGSGSEQDKFANLLGHFGQLTNVVSLVVSLFGFSFLVRKLNVKLTLLIYPTLLFIAVVISNLVPKLSVLFVMVSVLKALTFSLSEPVKELLYVPTSDAIKFKAKGWIDIFGSRLAKAIGSFATGLSGGSIQQLRMATEIPCILLSVGILLLSWSIGGHFDYLIANNIVIGDGATIDRALELQRSNELEKKFPVRNGKRYGEVGYDGYDLHLFDGVFEDEKNEEKKNDVPTPSDL